MMQLAIFNGSPRGKISNSSIIIEHFIEGYQSNCEDKISINYLREDKNNQTHIQEFLNSDKVAIFFPLYTDSVPGYVKYFIDSIPEGNYQNKEILFFVQSGFPEGVHTSYIEKYLERLSDILGTKYIGTIRKGGVEGLRIRPYSSTKSFRNDVEYIATIYAKEGKLPEEVVTKMFLPHKLSPINAMLFKLLTYTGLTDLYWLYNLLKNKAWKKRKATPYN